MGPVHSPSPLKKNKENPKNSKGCMPCGCGACGASGPGGCGMGSMPTGGCPTMPTGCPMGGCPMGGCASADAKKRFGIQVSSGQFLLKELMYCIVWVWPLPVIVTTRMTLHF